MSSDLLSNFKRSTGRVYWLRLFGQKHRSRVREDTKSSKALLKLAVYILEIQGFRMQLLQTSNFSITHFYDKFTLPSVRVYYVQI